MTLPPVSMTKKRMMVMPISRMRNSAVTTQPSTALPNSLKIAATISVPQVSSLSAIGSMSLPSSVTWLYLRAIQPSSLSVQAAMMKIIAATQRIVVFLVPHAPAMTYNARKMTTRTIREKVTMFGGAFHPSSRDDLRSSCFSIPFTLPRYHYLAQCVRLSRSIIACPQRRPAG